MNQLGATLCPSVICKQSGCLFSYLDEATGQWIETDDLPDEVETALPAAEWGRCVVHKAARLGERRRA